MTDIETRLREGLRAEAARVQPHLLRELRIPPRRRLRMPWRRSGPLLGPRLLPWLAPVAAALAVVAVIAGVRLGVGHGPAAGPRVTPEVTAAAPAVPMPPYYVSANLHSQDRAWVNDSATGQVIAKVGVKGQLPIAISAAADDRTFALVFQDLYRPAFTTFMRLTLRADGHPAAFQRLPVNVPPGTALESAGGTAEGVALSPDGQTLALVLSVQSESELTNNPRLELISLRTGATRTWVAPAGDVITDLSWARGSQTLAFLAGPQGSGHAAPATPLHILDVSRPPGGLLASSTPVRLRTSGGQVMSLVVTDNGARAVGWIWLPVKRGSTTRGTLILAEFSTRTGQRLRIFSRLNSVHSVAPFGEVFSADPSGQHILLYSLGILGTKTVYTTPQVQTFSPPAGSSGTPRTQTLGPFRSVEAKTDAFFARLDNGRVTRLPSPAQDDSEFGAW
jgi:dipeptidyl aminopeptidase/acylaminoacyl peptidase